MLRVKERLQAYELTVLKEMLAKCNSSQQAIFTKIFGPVSEIPISKRMSALLLVERTLVKNDRLNQSMSPQEFEELRIGDVIQHIATGDMWLVAGLDHGQLTLVCTLVVSNFEEWQRP